MANFEYLKPGQVGLITQDEDGRIFQLAMTEEQSSMLQILCSHISKGNPFIKMGEKHDLVLKRQCCEKCKAL